VNFFGLYWLFIPLIPLFIFFDSFLTRVKSRKIAATLIAPMLSGFLYCIFVIKVGGDFMHGRFFLPGLFGMLLPVAVIAPDIPWRSKRAYVPIAFLLAAFSAWTLICASSLRMTIENQHSIGDERSWYTRRAETRNPTSIEDYAPIPYYKDAKSLLSRREKTCPDKMGICKKYVLMDITKYGRLKGSATEFPVNEHFASQKGVIAVMRGAVGILSVVGGSKIHVIDHFGLTDPIASRLILKKRRRPGHEKRLSNAWFVARFADMRQIKDAKAKAADQALHCAPLSDLIAAIQKALTLKQFFLNIRNAYRFNKLRVPTDPIEARDTFCQSQSRN
jgi:arabinofuranosyltransferase